MPEYSERKDDKHGKDEEHADHDGYRMRGSASEVWGEFINKNAD